MSSGKKKKELLEVMEGGYLFRYGVEGVDGFCHKVASFENEFKNILGQSTLLRQQAAQVRCFAAWQRPE